MLLVNEVHVAGEMKTVVISCLDHLVSLHLRIQLVNQRGDYLLSECSVVYSLALD